MQQTTSLIIRNIPSIDELRTDINGLIGRGIAHWTEPNMVIYDVRSVAVVPHKSDDAFDVLVLVSLEPESEE